MQLKTAIKKVKECETWPDVLRWVLLDFSQSKCWKSSHTTKLLT